MKAYYIQENIGKVKYVINYHDGVKCHKDGSPFYDIITCSNIRKLGKKQMDLLKQGYTLLG